MKANFQFDEGKVNNMPVTIQLTADLRTWREIKKELQEANTTIPHRARFMEVEQCISNIIAQVEESTGHSYKSASFEYGCTPVTEDDE